MSKPCRPYPDNASYKTIGLDPCPTCGSSACWSHYLRWEKRTGVTLNVTEHPDDRDTPGPPIGVDSIE